VLLILHQSAPTPLLGTTGLTEDVYRWQRHTV